MANMVIDPRSVSPSHLLRWFGDGLRLSTRRAPWFVLLVLLPLPAGLTGSALLQLLLMPGLLACGVVLARSGEQDSNGLQDMILVCRTTWKRLLLFSTLGTPVVLAVAAMISLLIQAQGNASPAPPPDTAMLLSYEPANIILIVLFLWFVSLGPILWFLPPLLTIDGLPLRIGLKLAIKAYRRNLFVALITSATAMLFAFGTMFSVLLFPLFAVVVCAMYLSYRDIFHGEAMKLATRHRARIPATSH